MKGRRNRPATVRTNQIHGLNAAGAVAQKISGNGIHLNLPGRKHVMIAIPSMKGSLTTKIATLMCECVLKGLTPGGKWVFSFQIINDFFPTEYARNVLCRHFLNSNAEYLWFIDSDTMPDDNWHKLFEVDEDIVAGIYPIGRQEKGNRVLALDWGFYDKSDDHEHGWIARPVEAYRNDEVVEVDAVATGCMLIKRKVIEHFAKTAERDEDDTPAIFFWPKKSTGKSYCSDDFDFCTRVKAAGFKIKVHTAVRWGHLKFKDLRDVYEQMKSAWMAGYEESMEESEADALKQEMELEDGSPCNIPASRAI